MLNAGQEDSDRADDPKDTSGASSENSPATGASPDDPRSAKRLRWIAALFGVLGTVLALSIPFLPVNYQITTLEWPTAQGTRAVSAPLVNYSPISIDASTTCATARGLDARTDGSAMLFSTTPLNSDYGKLTGMSLRIDNGQLTLLTRGQVLSSVPLPQGDCDITLHSDGSHTEASVGDQQLADDKGDHRPQLTGIYSDLNSSDDVRGLSVKAEVDDRFESQPTPLKLTVIALTVLSFIGSVVALRKLDFRAGRRPPRLAPPRWWKPTLRDAAVVASLGIWWLVGAMTSDDGYIFTIARARADQGFIGNYFRWFSNPEAPWNWDDAFLSLWVQVSTSTPWVRLPALLMGLASWLLISREVLPRLGQRVRRSNAAGWAAAAVFLAFWLPYNNGLRPEPFVVLFSLLALCAVERSVATRRLMPAALGLVAAALSAGTNPHGIVAVMPFVAAGKPLLRLVRQRAREFGWVPVLAPIAASGLVYLTLAFMDQTFQSVLDGIALKKAFGPSDDWYQELNRYIALFNPTSDGSLARRFPVLLVMLCLATCLAVLLRRGRIRGAALGPSRRLLGVTALFFATLVFTPTKWSHHFGIFAAVGGALAALTALATSTTVLRSKRNRAGFLAVLLVLCAFSVTGPNGWWFVSGWGVPWFDKSPSLGGHEASTGFLLLAAIAGVVAVVEHMRIDEHRPKVIDVKDLEQRSRALRLGTAPLSIVCALLVVAELAAFGKAIQEQWGGYSLGADNVKQLAGQSCGLSDYVYVETNPMAGVLRPSPQQPTVAAPGTEVPESGIDEEEQPNDYLRARNEGFSRPGLPPGDGSSPDERDWQPPNKFGSDRAPVWGSYDSNGSGTGELRTQWYDLPERAASGEVPVVLTLAGIDTGGNTLSVEFGRDTEQGFEVMERRVVPPAQGAPPDWRDARITVNGAAEGATRMRIVAEDQTLGLSNWLAVSAPRAPQLTNMTDVVGQQATYVDWPAALVHPCLRIPSFRDGVAEMPRFRVSAGAEVRDIGQGWSSPDAGGPFGWMNINASMRELPTYLKNDLHRDWGSLYAVDPYAPEALPPQAAMRVRHETHWGTWSPGVLSRNVQLPGDVPSSDDRNDTQRTDGGDE